jgi:hypothetical protein
MKVLVTGGTGLVGFAIKNYNQIGYILVPKTATLLILKQCQTYSKPTSRKLSFIWQQMLADYLKMKRNV